MEDAMYTSEEHLVERIELYATPERSPSVFFFDYR